MFCQECGTQTSNNDSFCGKCGNPIMTVDRTVPVMQPVNTESQNIISASQNTLFICPRCTSNDIQSYEMVCQTGIISARSKSMGYIGGNVRSSYSTVTHTTEMSNIATSTLPPKRKGVFAFGKGSAGLVFLILGLIFLPADITILLTETFNVIMLIFCVIPLAFIVTAILFFAHARKEADHYNNTQYITDLNQWKRSYICLKCGNRFLISL